MGGVLLHSGELATITDRGRNVLLSGGGGGGELDTIKGECTSELRKCWVGDLLNHERGSAKPGVLLSGRSTEPGNR